jgi:hypothetical protein
MDKDEDDPAVNRPPTSRLFVYPHSVFTVDSFTVLGNGKMEMLENTILN